VKQLDAGKGERIPTLQEVMDLVRGKVILQIELKGPDTAEPVIQAVEQNSMENEVLLTSFVHDRLRESGQLNPNLRLGALWPNPPDDACEQAIDMGAEAIHIQHQNIDTQLIQKAHAHGLKIRAWNPDTVEEIQRVIDLGVDAIGSNRPDLLIAAGRTGL
jgi:glycerophosphoryl diester phosphodiesterase